jgi:hypothetical protein
MYSLTSIIYQQQQELIDLSSRSKGMFKLLKLDPQSVQAELQSADLIGVDPGLKSLITAVRSENLYDKMQITKGTSACIL